MEMSSDHFALLPPDLAARVRDGELHLAPDEKWASPDKPVVLDAKNRMVAGSGGYARAAVQAAANGRVSAYKQTTSYKQALELLIPHGLPEDEARERRITFEGLVELAFDAAEGEQEVPCPHAGTAVCPDDAVHKLRVAKPDGKLIFQLIELLAGKAKETIETSHTETKIAVLMAQKDVPLGVFDISPETAAERQRQMMEEGVIEGEWYEVDDGADE